MQPKYIMSLISAGVSFLVGILPFRGGGFIFSYSNLADYLGFVGLIGVADFVNVFWLKITHQEYGNSINKAVALVIGPVLSLIALFVVLYGIFWVARKFFPLIVGHFWLFVISIVVGLVAAGFVVNL